MSDVCVHGLGYIGLPTAAMLANFGHSVTGYDTDPEVRTALERGDVHIDEPGLRAFVTEAFDSGNLELADEARPAKYQIVCVPTPLDKETGQADLSYVESAGESIAPHLRTGDTVILESTVPPRTTVDMLRPILEASGLTGGSDFALVHCPETVLPGNVITELRENDRIIGGVNGISAEAAIRLYDSFVEGEIITAPDATTAEFVKLAQNTYRDANIAIANEFAQLASDYDIDSRDAIALANRHPRVNIHDPGPGVGGHCLPVDPWFLGHGSEQLDLIAHAREVNERMVDHVIGLLATELSADDVKIAILGAAYKGNVSDTRNSPGLALAQALREVNETETRLTVAGDRMSTNGAGIPASVSSDGKTESDGSERPTTMAPNGWPFERVEVAVHDEHVEDESLSSLDEALSGSDAVVITTDHDEYKGLSPADIEAQVESIIIDTKGVLDAEAWEHSSLTFRRI